jgi:hypothetical protein
MAHVEAAGDIGWRDGDAEGFAFAGRAEIPFGFPVFVPLALDVLWLVGFFHGFLLVTVWLIHKGKLRRSIIHAPWVLGEPWGEGHGDGLNFRREKNSFCSDTFSRLKFKPPPYPYGVRVVSTVFDGFAWV